MLFIGEKKAVARRSFGKQPLLTLILLLAAWGGSARYEQCSAAATSTSTSASGTGASASHNSDIEKRVLDFLAAGKQADAEMLLQHEIAQVPVIQQAIGFLNNGEPTRGLSLAKANSAKFQEAQRILFLYGACLRSRFDVYQARHVFLVTYDRNTPTGICALFVLHLDSLDRDPAKHAEALAVLKDLNTLVEQNPDDVVIRWMLAVECRTWKQNAVGVENFKRILESWQPGPVLVHQTYANLLDDLGRSDEALIERKKAVEMEPSGWSYDGLANTLANLKRYPESNEAHATAVKLNPVNSSHLANWASHLNDQGKFPEAINKAKQAIELDKKNTRAWCTWGKVLEALGNREDALEKYKSGLAINPSDAWFQKKVAELEYDKSK